MTPELYALSDVAKLLVCKPHRILYLLAIDPSLEPHLRVAGKRLWTMAEIARISERLNLTIAVDLQQKGGTDER